MKKICLILLFSIVQSNCDLRSIVLSAKRFNETINSINKELDENIALHTGVLAACGYGSYYCYHKAQATDETDLKKPIFYAGTIILATMSFLMAVHMISPK